MILSIIFLLQNIKVKLISRTWMILKYQSLFKQWVIKNPIFHWYIIPFLLKAVEGSLWYFYEIWLTKHKPTMHHGSIKWLILLKSVHFKNPVTRSSFLSKALSFLLTLFWFQRKWNFGKKWGLRNCFLKMNGLLVLPEKVRTVNLEIFGC